MLKLYANGQHVGALNVLRRWPGAPTWVEPDQVEDHSGGGHFETTPNAYLAILKHAEGQLEQLELEVRGKRYPIVASRGIGEVLTGIFRFAGRTPPGWKRLRGAA